MSLWGMILRRLIYKKYTWFCGMKIICIIISREKEMPAVIAHGSNGIKGISNIFENSARWDLIQMEGGNGVIINTI